MSCRSSSCPASWPDELSWLERRAARQSILTLAERWRISTLRAAPRTIGGVTGDELVKRVTEMNDAVVYSFWREVDGTKDKVLVPHCVFQMTTGEGRNEPVPTSLSQDAAMALWDKISSSIRLRPAAPPKPLAAYAWAGERCPASGWWRCEDPRALDGIRWLARGSLLPSATFALPSGACGRSANAARSIERRGTWRLERLADGPNQLDSGNGGEST